MIVIPALDLRGGSCVQVRDSTAPADLITTDDPIEVARTWEQFGFRRLHVMDRDGSASRTAPVDVVAELLADVPLLYQVGGAISSGDQVERLVSNGAGFVVLGPRALTEPEWLAGTASAFPHQLIVSVRLHERTVQADGNRQRLVTDFLQDLASIPLAAVLLSPDYHGDGIANEYLPVLEDAAESSVHPVLVAGGVHAFTALRALQDRGIAGVIVGSALYSGLLDARRVAEEFSE